MKILLPLLVLAGVHNSPAAEHVHSSSNGVVTVSPVFINQLAEEARTNHPALRAANARVEAADFDVSAVRRWEDPMFKLGGVVTSPRSFRTSDEGDLIYGLEQKLPLFGKAESTRRVAAAGSTVRRAEVDYRFQNLRKEIAKAVLRAALAGRTLEIEEQDLASLTMTVALMEEKYRAGAATQTELLLMQTERSRRADQLRTAGDKLDHERLTLNRLLNRELRSPWPKLELPPVARPVPDLPFITALAVKNEPRLKVMRQERAQAEAVTTQTRRQRWPEVSVSVEGRQFSGDGGFREGMFTVSLSLPWLNADKYRQDQRRDEAKTKAIEAELADLELAVREEIHHLIVTIDAARREAVLYRDEIIPRARQAMAAALAAWEGGRGQARDVLEARRMLLDSQLMAARAVAEQYSLMAELILCCGLGDLEALEMIGENPPNQAQKSEPFNSSTPRP